MMRILLLPFRLVFLLLVLPLWLVRLPLKLLGIRGAIAFGVGAFVALLTAPGDGADMRRRLRERFEEVQANRASLGGMLDGGR